MADSSSPTIQPASAAALIAAIHDDRLAELDDPEARAVCSAIGRRTAEEVAAAVAILDGAGLRVAVDRDPGTPSQRHVATLQLAGPDDAITAAGLLQPAGYRPWHPIEGAARQVLRRMHHSLTVARTDDVTTVLTLSWPAPRLGGRLPSVMIPNENDFEAVDLPSSLWPLHMIVRPARLVAERLGLRRSSGHGLGPFLSTPIDLITPLLDLAGVGPDDTLVDLGCGDARVLRHAVTERGCRGVGVESNPSLVAEARRLVDESGSGDRITIIEGDVLAERLGPEAERGSVFFGFVPAYSVPAMADRVLARARPGSRLVVHEQHRMPDFAAGHDLVSVPLLSGQGVTVAHMVTVTA